MKTTGGTDAQKHCATTAAIEAVEDGTVVGLGTGSTTAFAIRAIGDCVADGLDVQGVPTSFAARELARGYGIPVVDLDETGIVGPAIDGTDQVALADSMLVKGDGAAHAREKMVNTFTDRFLVIADPPKVAEMLSHAAPVEVLPSAQVTVATGVSDLGDKVTLRRAERKGSPVIAGNKNPVLDCEFSVIPNPGSLATDLTSPPGAVEHGLLVGLAGAVYIGIDGGVEVIEL